MSSIPSELIALDTNIYVFAVRSGPRGPSCARLLNELPDNLRVFLPLQVQVELRRNLGSSELSRVIAAVQVAARLEHGVAPADAGRIDYWSRMGAKRGDTALIAELEAAGVTILVSENRHLLREVQGLPFRVVSADDAIGLLTSA